jgi:hypothetical protein
MASQPGHRIRNTTLSKASEVADIDLLVTRSGVQIVMKVQKSGGELPAARPVTRIHSPQTSRKALLYIYVWYIRLDRRIKFSHGVFTLEHETEPTGGQLQEWVDGPHIYLLAKQ